jgi:co-chaperonin GroES (HSP10)
MSKECCGESNKCQTVEIKSASVVIPTGNQILLELLTAQEILGTKIIVNDSKTYKEFQAIVLAEGPLAKCDQYGFKIGDRVILSGTGVPVPNFNNTGRDRVLMEPNCVKAILA